VRVDPADWKRVLAKVTGRFVRGQHRVSTRELLERLCVPIPASDKTVKQLRPIMHELGWHGPQMLRFDKKTLNGYWRPPTVGGVFSPDVDDFDFASDAPATVEEGVVELSAFAEARKCNDSDAGAPIKIVSSSVPAPSGPVDALPRKLERVTLLGLEKIEQILRLPTDVTDGNLLRAQTTAALGAVNSQLRADETRLRAKQQGDVLERLLKVMAEERKKLAAREDGETEAIRLKDLRPSGDESKD
jgi:hypothetical protein